MLLRCLSILVGLRFPMASGQGDYVRCPKIESMYETAGCCDNPDGLFRANSSALELGSTTPWAGNMSASGARVRLSLDRSSWLMSTELILSSAARGPGEPIWIECNCKEMTGDENVYCRPFLDLNTMQYGCAHSPGGCIRCHRQKIGSGIALLDPFLRREERGLVSPIFGSEVDAIGDEDVASAWNSLAQHPPDVDLDGRINDVHPEWRSMAERHLVLVRVQEKRALILVPFDYIPQGSYYSASPASPITIQCFNECGYDKCKIALLDNQVICDGCISGCVMEISPN